MEDIIAAIPLLLLCATKFVVGVPSAIAFYKFGFMNACLFSFTGGAMGVLAFALLGKPINAFIDWCIAGIFKLVGLQKRKKRTFTKFNRLVVWIMLKFGLAGLAFITPMLISIPVGSVIAVRLYKRPLTVLPALLLSVGFWSLVYVAFLNLFPFIW